MAGNYQPNAHDMVPLEMLACLPLHCCSGRVRRHAQEAALVVGGLQVLRMEAETFARHALVAAACVGPPRISALTFDLKASAKGKASIRLAALSLRPSRFPVCGCPEGVILFFIEAALRSASAAL